MIALLLVLPVLAAQAAPADDLDRVERALAHSEAALVFFTRRTAMPEHHSLAQRLGVIEASLRDELVRIDSEPDLLTDPALRQRRSELAVEQLRFRIPIIRARLLAYTPAARSSELRTALDELNAIDFVWGRAIPNRHAAIGALHWRLRDSQSALVSWQSADAVDPLARYGRIAATSALGRLDEVPQRVAILSVAIAGAAHGRGPVAAQVLAQRALTEAPAGRVDAVRTAVLETLAGLQATPGDPPLVTIARTEDARLLAALSEHDDAFLAAEAKLRRWSLDPADPAPLIEAAMTHPGGGARHRAAVLSTGFLEDAEPELTLRAARAFLLAWPRDEHADRWRLALGAVAEPAEALEALDAVAETSLHSAALLLAAVKSREAFEASPGSRGVESAHRARIARDALAGPEERERWAAWLWDTEVQAVSSVAGLLIAGELLLTAPASEAALAAEHLAPPLFDLSLEAEATNDGEALVKSAALTAKVAAIAQLPVLEARSLTLAGVPEQALRVLSGQPVSHALTLARAEALFVLRRDTEAFPLFRGIAESHEANRRDTDAFWRSWTRLLQIIARQTDVAERHGDIAREINRLKILDSQLGGNPHRRRLELLLQSATATPPPGHR